MTTGADTFDMWPAGATWVFQGTVAEDATGGTHICTLTITPGAGNELRVLYGLVIVGNTATAQACDVFIDDGTNKLGFLFNADGGTATTANLSYPFPQITTVTALGATSDTQSTGFEGAIVSGTMRLVLRVITAAISVTQTFSVACRIKGAVPTATLGDTVGTPVLTTNTNAVF